MAWKPKINRHVTYMQRKTIGGNTNYVKPRAAVITGIVSGTTVNVRVGHHSETYASVTQMRNQPGDVRNGTYYMG
jgi:hypothetical protein